MHKEYVGVWSIVLMVLVSLFLLALSVFLFQTCLARRTNAEVTAIKRIFCNMNNTHTCTQNCQQSADCTSQYDTDTSHHYILQALPTYNKQNAALYKFEATEKKLRIHPLCNASICMSFGTDQVIHFTFCMHMEYVRYSSLDQKISPKWGRDLA